MKNFCMKFCVCMWSIYVVKAHDLGHCNKFKGKYPSTIIPEIFSLLIFAHIIFVVIYCLQFQESVNIRCSKNSLKLSFRVFNFCNFSQLRIINNRENFQNYGITSSCTNLFIQQLQWVRVFFKRPLWEKGEVANRLHVHVAHEICRFIF